MNTARKHRIIYSVMRKIDKRYKDRAKRDNKIRDTKIDQKEIR